jgi:hypothetical protein
MNDPLKTFFEKYAQRVEVNMNEIPDQNFYLTQIGTLANIFSYKLPFGVCERGLSINSFYFCEVAAVVSFRFVFHFRVLVGYVVAPLF